MKVYVAIIGETIEDAIKELAINRTEKSWYLNSKDAEKGLENFYKTSHQLGFNYWIFSMELKVKKMSLDRMKVKSEINKRVGNERDLNEETEYKYNGERCNVKWRRKHICYLAKGHTGLHECKCGAWSRIKK